MTSENTTRGTESMSLTDDGFLVQPKGFATKAIHVGQDSEQWNSKAVVPPIILSTTFKQDGPGQNSGFEYGRCGNPTRQVLQTCLAGLENAKHALTFSSGLGAVTAIVTMLKAGDHILAGDDLYGGTNRLLKNLAMKMNISIDFVDATDLVKLEAGIKTKTKMLWMETPTNPLLKIVDIKAVSRIAHKFPGVFVVVDNTFLSSYFQRPLELGADMVMYSLAKFMNGHTDVIMGAVVTSNEELFQKIEFSQISLGIVPSPFDCYLVNRSLKTLALRMEKHKTNSIAVAKYLEKHPKVVKVIHPGLPSHPQHKLAMSQSYGHSGMMSFYIKGKLEESTAFLKALKLFTFAVSLGGNESLAQIPSKMSHDALTQDEKTQLGITDNLIRMSVGLEDESDLIEDLAQALASV